MADLDTVTKRASGLNFLHPATLQLPIPDATLDQGDRQHIAMQYAGILAAGYTPPVTPTLGSGSVRLAPYSTLTDTRRVPQSAQERTQRVVVLSGADILIPLSIEVGAVEVRRHREVVVTGTSIAIGVQLRVGKVRVERLADTEEEDVLALLGLLPLDIE